MLSRPNEATQKRDIIRNKFSHTPIHSVAQHGKASHSQNADNLLLRVPSETLTHITSFLDPPALLALSRANKDLYAHVKDDNTWQRAYVYRFLGISPESDLRDDGERKSLMLRREESTWRKEFMLRYTLRRRWERSRNQPLTHIPHHSDVSALHLMPSTTLLTSSLRYGIVARSYPLTGKVLRGYLDATGTANGLGWGNPNAEFSPHVTAISLASEGRTAKVLWGFRNGEVAVSTAARAMDGSRPSAAKHVRSQTDECHEGAVHALAWGAVPGAEGPTVFATGAADGRIKLWDAKNVKCMWTSGRAEVATDPYVKVAIDVARGIVVGAMESGVIVLWHGFGPLLSEQVDRPQVTPHEIRIPAVPAFSATSPPAAPDPQRGLLELQLASVNDGKLSLLAAYRHDPYCYRLSVDLESSEVQRMPFGSGDPGTVSAVKAIFASQAEESNFIVVGDTLGCIGVFNWDAQLCPGENSIQAVRKFDAHEDEAITALAWNPFVLVSGSARGTVKVWDALLLTSLRSFSSPTTRLAGGGWDGVGQILLERDVVVVSVGKKVMAWKAGPVGTHHKANVKGKQSRVSRNAGLAKWQQQLEMYRDIAESRKDLEEEQSHTRRAFGREREQQSTLAHLGLNEVEAVEYILMLSRDEDETRRRQEVAMSSTSTALEDEGIFMADFDDLQTPVFVPNAFMESQPPASTSSRTPSFSGSPPSKNPMVIDGRSLPPTAPSPSNYKVQVSPHVRPEPMEAGFSMSPLSASLASSISARNSMPAPSTADLDQFPAMSRTPSSTGLSVPSASGSPPVSRRSMSSSLESSRSAWSTPLRSTRSSPSVSSPIFGPAAITSSPSLIPRLTPPRRLGNSGPSLISTGFATCTDALYEDSDQEEKDLRLAIQLSLAEARSRGEDIDI